MSQDQVQNGDVVHFPMMQCPSLHPGHWSTVMPSAWEFEELKIKLDELDNIRTLEKYARENHYFKKEDEDIFIFSFE